MSLLDHFRPEEKPFVERVIEWVELTEVRKKSRLTFFLDPREQFIVASIVGRSSDVKVSFEGGYKEAERKRGLITPDFLHPSHNDYNLALLSIRGSYKSIPFSHRDILGALLGLGIKRETLGDILISEQHVQIIATGEMARFIDANLFQIGKASISCERIDFSQLIAVVEEWLMKEASVSSLRLDNILAELLSLSRTKANPLIKSGRVKVNWKTIDQPSMQLQEGDILSVKGFGRFLFQEIEGITRKSKYRVLLGRKE
jgi:RNA-binding protein YlmH